MGCMAGTVAQGAAIRRGTPENRRATVGMLLVGLAIFSCLYSTLFTWQNFLPGIWTCFLFRESETYIRTDLMAGAEIYHRASGNSWAVSNDIDLLRLPTDCVDKSKVARSLLYPAPTLIPS